MKKLIFLFIFFIAFVKGQVPNWIWGVSAIGKGDLNGVALDNLGNIYAAGVFGPNTMVFNTTTLSVNYGGTSDMFLTKYNSSGNVIWSRQAVINGQDRAVGIATDVNNNSYVVGDFKSGISLDTVSLNSYPNNNTDNVFVAKFDPNGNVMWAKRAGGDYYSNSYSIATDLSGNVLITGHFIGSYINFGTITITNPDPVNKTSCMFLAKYDTNGNILWVKKSSGNGAGTSGCWPSSVTTDALGNIYLTGAFDSNTATFGSFLLTNSGNTDVFIVKYNSNGNELWAKKAGGNSDDNAISVKTDANGDIILGGYFTSSTITFGTNTLVNPNSNLYKENLFLVKYDVNGNVKWAKNKDRTRLSALSCDNIGNSYLLGNYRDSVTFGSSKLKYNFFGNIYLSKYDVNGNDIWGKDVKITTAATGNSFVMPHTLAPKINNEIYFGGGFDCKRIQLDSCLLANFDSTGNSRAIMLGKINTLYVGIHEIGLSNENISIFPNPTNGILNVLLTGSTADNYKLEVLNNLGQIVYQSEINNEKLQINISQLQSGLYFIKLESKRYVKIQKLVKE